MKRDPSIHVSRSSLFEALEDILVQEDPEFIVNELFQKLNKNAIRNRVVVTVKSPAKKKAARVASVDKELAKEFHLVYQQINRQHNIRTSAIKETDSKYATLKEVAQQAADFCTMFELESNFGFQTYITVAIKLSKNKEYSIYRIKGMSDRIIKYYQDMLTINDDSNEKATRDFYVAWKQVSMKYLGYDTTIEEPHLFVHFIHGRTWADKYKANYDDWVSAQFERWAGSMPELSQMHGENAALSYTKFMGLTNKELKTDEEKQYFKSGKVQVKTVKRQNRKG